MYPPQKIEVNLRMYEAYNMFLYIKAFKMEVHVMVIPPIFEPFLPVKEKKTSNVNTQRKAIQKKTKRH